METIKLGSKGEDVKKLQTALKLTADGVFGKKTEEALKKFQKENGLTADGICGNKTWEKLLPKKEDSKCVDACVTYKPLSVHITKSINRPIKYLSIHFTAGSNSKEGKALSEFKTFTSRSASADFCVDDKDILQFNPDLKNYYCWAVGDKKQNTGGASLNGKATNKNTISIEICSTCKPSTSDAVSKPNHSGWSFTDAALANAEKLAKILIKKFNIPKENVVRHYDITGKLCPGIIGWNDYNIYDLSTKKNTSKKSNSDEWKKFKNKLFK